MEIRIVSSGESLLQEAARLRAEGWSVVSADEPERACLGYVGFRGKPEDEESLRVVWPFLGKELSPSVEDVDLDAYLEALGQDNAVLADNPKNLRFGVALYDTESGTARILRMRITQFKQLDRELQQFVNDRRQALRESWKARLPELPA
jgi:hypothetical protein